MQPPSLFLMPASAAPLRLQELAIYAAHHVDDPVWTYNVVGDHRSRLSTRQLRPHPPTSLLPSLLLSTGSLLRWPPSLAVVPLSEIQRVS